MVSLSGETRLCAKCSKCMPVPDLHLICDLCRGTICALDERCEICASWSTSYMNKYLKHMNMLIKTRERKRRARGRPSKVVPLDADSGVAGPSSASLEEDFGGFTSAPSIVAAPVTTVAASHPTTVLTTTSAAGPVVSSMEQGSHSVVDVGEGDEIGPDDSVSNTSSKLTRAIDRGLRDFRQAQEGRERAFQAKLLNTVNASVANALAGFRFAHPTVTNPAYFSAPSPSSVSRPSCKRRGDPSGSESSTTLAAAAA